MFFGIRSYRENVGAGTLSFGRGLAVGVLIITVASVCYVATWQLIYYKLAPDFGEKYAAHMIDKERAKGASEQEIEAKTSQVAKFQELYDNLIANAAITFIELFPIGVVVALVSAAILRKKQALPKTYTAR